MKKYLFYVISALCLIACSAVNLPAQEQKAEEYQVKALFLCNFINFVDWPADSSIHSSPTINVCVIGDDPFGNALDGIRDKTFKDKKLAIRFYRSYDDPKGCHLLFIPATENRHSAQILKSVREANVLTVGDTEESARQGAIIGFYIEQKKVRFAINIEAARRAGLKISAKLLKLAKIIKVQED
jgi:hypothetical protein